MPIIVSEIKISPTEPKERALEKALSLLGLHRAQNLSTSIARISVDARNKENVRLVCSVAVSCEDEERIYEKHRAKNIALRKIAPAHIPMLKSEPKIRPVIIGFGPAGMFAGLYLARAGARPIIFERGAKVEERAAAVEEYWRGGALNREANVQFGEGGAGTFSDGKLTTRINDPRCDFVLREFEKHGAPGEILIKAKPHIGTDRLRSIVKSIREEVISLGGEVHFLSQVTDIEVKSGKVRSVTVNDAQIPAENIILAAGHSARDTFSVLKTKGVLMEAKPFSVGVRIEHLQEDINRAQYGDFAENPALWAAEYQLSYKTENRCAYTFCMCPGGTVVAAASEKKGVIVNGMSSLARDGENSNAALLVGIETKDFPSEHPLAGIYYQREIEHNAYELAGASYKAPAQLVGDFLKGIESKALGSVKPTCPTGVTLTNLDLCLPEKVSKTMKSAIVEMDKKLNGFNLYDAVLTAPETRSSSSVRILRDEYLQCNISGVYPCGEGAGYAGGIVSAAVDGIKCAHSVLEDNHYSY